MPYGSGHINDTFAVVYNQAGKPVRYIHQRVNHKIFQDVPALMDNISRVTTHQQKLLNDALLSINLQVGSSAGMDSSQLQSYALRRYAALHLASELHVPNPTAAELTDHLKSLPVFAGEDGKFDKYFTPTPGKGS